MAYALAASYVGESLLSGFGWFDGVDPSHGYVAYQSRANAEAKGLFSVDEKTGVVRLGVDHKNTYGLGEGRPSIRLESKEAYDNGLFIADFLHMPPSQCGMWPAFWTYGANWPAGGEVDIIEGVNTMHQNTISAHTVDGCSLSSSLGAASSGTMVHADCAVGRDNIGCGFAPAANDPSSYGDGFNAANGGVYAMLRDSDYIKVWHFARGEIPGDIEAKRPDPGLWKLPDAVFGGPSCDVDTFFKGMNLVININFCGDWGNAVWGKSDQCNHFAPTCNEYVAKNPQAFANAYWDVKYIDVYRRWDGNPSTRRPGTNATRTSSSAQATGVMSSNPARVGKYAHLGCFGSGSGFPTFGKVAESGAMTLEMCVDACDGRNKTFAGVFEATCYCAGELDADTRATSADEGGVCDHACPGDGGEVCGGLVGRGPGAAMNPTAAVATPQRFDNGTRPRAAPGVPSGVPPRRVFRRDMPGNHLLTMYGAVASDASSSPSLPPPMAPQWNKTLAGAATQTVFRTVYPLQVVYDMHCATSSAALDPPVAVPATTDPPVAAGGDEAARDGKQGATRTIALQSVPKAGSVGAAAPPAPTTPRAPLPPPASAGVPATDDAALPGPEATSRPTAGSTAQPQGQNLFPDVPVVVAAAPGTAGEAQAAAALRAAALLVVMAL